MIFPRQTRSGVTPKYSVAPPRLRPEVCHHFIEDQGNIMPGGNLAYCLQEFNLRRNDPQPKCRDWLQDHAAQLIGMPLN